MNALKKTLFILATVSVVAYTVRHVYYKWFEIRESVLDRYATTVANKIKDAQSLDELLKMYDESKKAVQTYEGVKTNPEVRRSDRKDIEPYKSEIELRKAIEDWEAKTRDIFKLRFYWIVGFLLLLLGYLVYVKWNTLLGLTLIIIGFTQQVYWTSPDFLSGTGIEYDRLLTNKLSFSIATVFLLVVVAFLTDTLKTRGDENRLTSRSS